MGMARPAAQLAMSACRIHRNFDVVFVLMVVGAAMQVSMAVHCSAECGRHGACGMCTTISILGEKTVDETHWRHGGTTD